MTNATRLINSLRAKVSQQKELLSRAKSELADQKQLKDRIIELESEITQLKTSNPNSFNPHTTLNTRRDIQSPAIKMPSRLSLRSPQITNFMPPNPPTMANVQLYQEPTRPPPPPTSYYHPVVPHQMTEYFPVQFYPPPPDTNYPPAIFTRPPPPQSVIGGSHHAYPPTRPVLYDPRTSYSPSRGKRIIKGLFHSCLVRICCNNAHPTSSCKSSLSTTLTSHIIKITFILYHYQVLQLLT